MTVIEQARRARAAATVLAGTPRVAKDAALTAIKVTTGVVEHGLFIALTDTVIVAGSDGPRAIGRASGGA